LIIFLIQKKLYLIEHFDMYQDALNAKKDRKKPEEYFVLYKGAGGEFFADEPEK